MDIPSREGFTFKCGGHEYAASCRTYDEDAPASKAHWWVLIDGEDRLSPHSYSPAETRDAVIAKLCAWIGAGAVTPAGG